MNKHEIKAEIQRQTINAASAAQAGHYGEARSCLARAAELCVRLL